MSDSGTAIERSRRADIDRTTDRRTASGAMVSEIVPSGSVAVARESHVRHAELTSRILSLLTDVGTLALRIVEARLDVGAQAAAVLPGSQETRAPRAQGAGKKPLRRSGEVVRGQGRRRQRQRRRGDR